MSCGLQTVLRKDLPGFFTCFSFLFFRGVWGFVLEILMRRPVRVCVTVENLPKAVKIFASHTII